MLSVFPEILFLSPYAVTILRVAAACVFFYAGAAQIRMSPTLAQVPLPLIGSGMWIVWTSVIFHLIVGALLFAGAYTQVAALAGMVGAAFSLTIGAAYLERILSRGAVALTIVILSSLLLTGAGALAFDLPL